MRTFAFALVVLAGAAPAWATQPAPTTDLGNFMVGLNGAPAQQSLTGLRAIADGYRDFAAPSTLNGVVTTGLGRLDGDDLQLVPNGGNYLDTMGFSIANRNTAAGQNLTSMTMTINFFDSTGTINLGSFSTNLNLVAIFGASGLPANNSATLAFPAGALASFNIWLTNNCFVTQTYSNVVGVGGANPALVGYQVRNPPVVGASTDSLVLNGAITPAPFGGNPAGNFSYFISLNSVPAPGSMALVGLGGILAARRRR